MALILVKHGLHHPVEQLKLSCVLEDDHVVLIQDGVFWAISDGIKNVKAKVSAVQPDLCARGYAPEASQVPLVGYAELVDIIESQPKTIS